MVNALDALIEIFTWVGFGLGAFAAGAALIAYLVDGTWVAARAVVEHLDDRVVVRWFDGDGGVNEARLSPVELHEVGGRDMADIWVRQGSANRMRLHRRSPVVRLLATIAGVLLGLGVVSMILSLVLLFGRG